MVAMTDWAGLWRELSLLHRQRMRKETPGKDTWEGRAHEYQAVASRRWLKPDSSRDAIAQQVAATPRATVLDIGAGTGAWSIYLAPCAAKVTALDPSPAMLAVLRENLAGQQVKNVDVVQAAWPDAAVTEHDFSLCSHAMYGSPDLPAFLWGMEQVTRRTCFLVVRAPAAGGVMADAARYVWGHPYDSPNFEICYNVLLQMGIRANVRFENLGHWAPWVSASLKDALDEVKRRLALDTDKHDAFLLELLESRLSRQDGELVWPNDMRSALISWTPGER